MKTILLGTCLFEIYQNHVKVGRYVPDGMDPAPGWETWPVFPFSSNLLELFGPLDANSSASAVLVENSLWTVSEESYKMDVKKDVHKFAGRLF